MVRGSRSTNIRASSTNVSADRSGTRNANATSDTTVRRAVAACDHGRIPADVDTGDVQLHKPAQLVNLHHPPRRHPVQRPIQLHQPINQPTQRIINRHRKRGLLNIRSDVETDVVSDAAGGFHTSTQTPTTDIPLKQINPPIPQWTTQRPHHL